MFHPDAGGVASSGRQSRVTEHPPYATTPFTSADAVESFPSSVNNLCL